IGALLSGAVRDILTQLLPNPIHAYVFVFGILVFLLFISLILLRRIDVTAFREEADSPSVIERAALTGEV
ncbi:unnamed protein product, partial [marine sediment metagenome]